MYRKTVCWYPGGYFNLLLRMTFCFMAVLLMMFAVSALGLGIAAIFFIVVSLNKWIPILATVISGWFLLMEGFNGKPLIFFFITCAVFIVNFTYNVLFEVFF